MNYHNGHHFLHNEMYMRSLKMTQLNWFAKGLAVFALASGSSLAETRVPNTYTYYSISADAITDVNTSYIAVDELYDQETDTFITIRCSDAGKQSIWSYVHGKNDIMTTADDVSDYPDTVIRLGSDAPIEISTASMYVLGNEKDGYKTDSLGFSATITKSIVAGLLANKKLVIRMTRATGGKPFTYTFPAAGFSTAWQKVNQCR